MRALFFVVLAAISVAWGQAASTLRLTVVDTHEFAVPGARVEARPLSGGTPISGLTGPDGTVELALDGPMEVFVQADGFEPLLRRLKTLESMPLVLRLQPEDKRRGFGRFEASGQRLESVCPDEHLRRAIERKLHGAVLACQT